MKSFFHWWSHGTRNKTFFGGHSNWSSLSFVEFWVNLGKIPSHHQKFACFYTYVVATSQTGMLAHAFQCQPRKKTFQKRFKNKNDLTFVLKTLSFRKCFLKKNCILFRKHFHFCLQIQIFSTFVSKTREDHYPVCQLDIRQDSELATGYGYPKTAFKREPHTDNYIRNAILEISRIQTLGKIAHCTIIHFITSKASFHSLLCHVSKSVGYTV